MRQALVRDVATLPSERWSEPTELLQALLRYGDLEERRRLVERMLQAQREERWSRRAVLLSAGIAGLCCFGLPAVSAELASVLEDTSLLLVEVARTLGVASILTLTVIGGWWLWNRGTLRRLHDDAARFTLGLLESRIGRRLA